MSGGQDLAALLARLDPQRRPGAFVFVTVAPGDPTDGAVATVLEDEGRTLVLERGDADRRGLPYDFVGAWITLGVGSGLDAVGLTAAVSARLASAGIGCNVLAGRHHDHLLVPEARAEEALTALHELSG